MTPLYFHAAAATAHPAVAQAVQAQARAALRPFRRYVAQAIHTARER